MSMIRFALALLGMLVWTSVAMAQTATPTVTPTSTFTQTSTVTQTFTVTQTVTKTNTPTKTPIVTKTAVPATATRTAVPATATSTITNTPTLTPTPTCGPSTDKRGIKNASICAVPCATASIPCNGTPIPADSSFGEKKTASCFGGSATVQIYCYQNYYRGPWPLQTPLPVQTPISCPGFVSWTDDWDACYCSVTTAVATPVSCFIDRIGAGSVPWQD